MLLMVGDSTENDIIFEPSEFPVLSVLYPDEMHFFRSIAQPLEVAADVAVITEGQQAQCLYMIHSGLLMVSKRHDNEIFEVGSVTPGEVFGEASILYDAPASAEVRSVEACSLFQVPGEQVRDVLESNERFQRSLSQLAERRQAATAVAVNPVFAKLPQAVRETLLYNAQFVSLEAGETLLQEGDSDTRFMFLVLGGKAEASMRHPKDPSKRIVFAHISAGDEVGEIAVITGKSHAATVTAVTPLRLMMINNESVHAWRKRYSDFGYSLYACVQRKLQHSLEAIRKVVGDEEAMKRTLETLPPVNDVVPLHRQKKEESPADEEAEGETS